MSERERLSGGTSWRTVESRGPGEALPNPECRDGKHRNCNGEGWDTWTDEPANCPCECHR